MTRSDFERMLIEHEGLRLKPYRDSVGKLTIGIGTNLSDGITRTEALWLMRHRLEKAEKELISRFPVYKELDTVRQFVLLDMAYNLGIPKLAGFKKMWAALDLAVSYDYGFLHAAAEMLDSKWARQVGNRAKDLAYMMATGTKKTPQ